MSPTRELPPWCQAGTSPNRERPTCVTTAEDGEEGVDDSVPDVVDVPVHALKLLPVVPGCHGAKTQMEGRRYLGNDFVLNWGGAA